jgi:hypothetical protein
VPSIGSLLLLVEVVRLVVDLSRSILRDHCHQVLEEKESKEVIVNVTIVKDPEMVMLLLLLVDLKLIRTTNCATRKKYALLFL